MAKEPSEKSAKIDAELAKRIRLRREKLGLTQLELAHALGWDTHQGVEKIENSKRGVTGPELGKIAETLDTSSDALLGRASARRHVPLFGDVGVGGVYYPDARSGRWMEVQRIEAPLGEEAADGCVRIAGQHLESAGYRDGDLLFFRFRGDPIDEVLGRRCLVQVRDGDALLGILVGRGTSPGKFLLRPLVDAPVREVAIEWAARIRWQQYA